MICGCFSLFFVVTVVLEPKESKQPCKEMKVTENYQIPKLSASTPGKSPGKVMQQ